MQQLINTVWRGLQWLGFNIGQWLSNLWSGFLEVASFFASWISSFFINLVSLVVEGVFALVLWAVELLPMMPEAPIGGGVSMLVQANRYIALGEILTFTALWATIFGALGLYKLVKLVRGGG